MLTEPSSAPKASNELQYIFCISNHWLIVWKWNPHRQSWWLSFSRSRFF